MNKILGKVLKFAFAAGIIGYLFYNAAQNDQFTTLLREPKDWPRIGLAFGLFFSGVCFTFFRWQLLVRALDFSFSTSKAFSLGFLGYLFNFVAPGGVGGDLFKAVFIAREYHGRRAQAVATVVIDRIVGLYGLFVVASGAVLINGLWKSPSASVRGVAYGTLLGTLIGAIGILMLLIPGSTNGRFSEFLGNLPRIGSVFRQLIGAVRMYRTRLGSVALALAISVFVHLLTVCGFYVVGMAIPGASPTLAEHFVIVPLAMVVSAVPITPGGLGTFELSIAELFATMSATPVSESRGLLVSLVYRIITIIIAMIGVGVYAVTRREVSEVMHEAEAEATAAKK